MAVQYRVLHLDTLPVNLLGANPWKSLTWESVLAAHAQSKNAWVAVTARAWLVQLASLVPTVDAETVWNDVPDDAGGFELALRARIAWLSRQLDACRPPVRIGGYGPVAWPTAVCAGLSTSATSGGLARGGPAGPSARFGESTQPVIARDQLIVHIRHNRSASPRPSGGRGGADPADVPGIGSEDERAEHEAQPDGDGDVD